MTHPKGRTGFVTLVVLNHFFAGILAEGDEVVEWLFGVAPTE